MPTRDVVVGIDVGTQGARVIAMTLTGDVLGENAIDWPLNRDHNGLHEQDPERWFDAVIDATGHVAEQFDTDRTAALSLTATSGTLVLVDPSGAPTRPAIMWDDTRAVVEADALLPSTADLESHTGLRLRSSFPLAKLAWLRQHEPSTLRSAGHVLHQSDYLLWRLGGQGDPTTDPTNALKTGYDPVTSGWATVLNQLDVRDRLPRVVDAGTVVGELSSWAASTTGLPVGLPLIAAMTDANTATLAAGVIRPGQWSSTLGTGLSIKALAERPVADSVHGVYSHRNPFGGWLASGTSHTGGGVVTARFGSDRAALTRLADEASQVPPGSSLDYPLAGRGEFFPFWAPDAKAFVIGDAPTEPARFRATLEGIAVIERMAVERMQLAGAPRPTEMIALGGSTRSSLWNRIRASMLETPLQLRSRADTAVGAAITAAIATGIPPLDAIADMVRPGPVIAPNEPLVTAYRTVRARYEAEFTRRGYLHP